MMRVECGAAALRHRLAILALSFAIVAGMVSVVIFGPLGDQVLARDGWANRDHYADGVVGALFGSVPEEAAAPAQASSPPRVRHASAWHWWPRRRATASRAAPVRVAATTPRVAGHSVCVRLCDGFYFPVGDVHGRQDIDSQTATCSGLCPGAPTRLFVVTSGDGDVGHAASATTGQLYTSLPMAYGHTREVGPTCGCHAVGAQAAVAPLKDFTLRSGDSIMTPVGWRVFQGATRYPYERTDFSGLASAANVSKKTRLSLMAMENATLGHPITVHAIARPQPPRMHLATSMTAIKSTDGQLVRLVGPNVFYTR